MRAKTHVGYLHRGFEKLMERRKYINCYPIVCRICVPEPDTNEYLLAAAIEELGGVTVPERGDWLRTLVLEMARLAHLTQIIGGQAGTVDLGTISQWGIYHRDLLLDSFEELTGGRIYHMYILPGGVRHAPPEGFTSRLLKTLERFDRLFDDIEKVMFHNVIFKMRTKGLAVIPRSWMEPFGITGTTARAAGYAWDVRKNTPYLKYPELSFDPLTSKASDVYDRVWLRLSEARMSLDLIRQILRHLPASGPVRTKIPNLIHWKIPRGETYVRCESGRGEMGYYLVADGSEMPRRVHVRGTSYTHALSLLERLLIGQSIADIYAIMVSIQTCPPEIER
jgi:NADH-quinone oxidoreductase subunit D